MNALGKFLRQPTLLWYMYIRSQSYEYSTFRAKYENPHVGGKTKLSCVSCVFRLGQFQPFDLSRMLNNPNELEAADSGNVKFTLGEIRNFIIRKLHSLDDIFEALAGGVEGDVMGHGKAIGRGG